MTIVLAVELCKMIFTFSACYVHFNTSLCSLIIIMSIAYQHHDNDGHQFAAITRYNSVTPTSSLLVADHQRWSIICLWLGTTDKVITKMSPLCEGLCEFFGEFRGKLNNVQSLQCGVFVKPMARPYSLECKLYTAKCSHKIF